MVRRFYITKILLKSYLHILEYGLHKIWINKVLVKHYFFVILTKFKLILSSNMVWMTVCDVGTVRWMGLKVLWLPHAPESPSHSLRALCLPPLTSQQPPPLLAAYRPTMSYRTWRHPYLLPPSSNISVETPKTPVVSLVSYPFYWNTLWNYLVHTGRFEVVHHWDLKNKNPSANFQWGDFP